jgi:protein SCO1
LAPVILDFGVSVQHPPVTSVPQPFRRLRWLIFGGALVLGIGVGVGIAVLHSSGVPADPGSAVFDPGFTWPAGKALAPNFALRDENARPISLEQFRGRPVILTFIDPVCRNLCPLEAKVLDQVVAQAPAAQRPAIVAVSANQWGDARANLLLDRTKWRLPSDWHWAVGSPKALARVWKDYYIAVSVATKTIAGIVVHRITHTEAAYIVDARGYKRALFVYPFRASDVERMLRSVTGA